ncbi:MAG: DUF4365 domain-containing protein [Actinomycetota bacterium]|nr:DUF4365 domain-containing protein [Actinomycetota bacterium]
MSPSRKQVRPNRPAELAAIRAVQTLFEDANHIYQAVLGSNDIGKDAYIDIVVDGDVTGDVIALQIKGGASFRRSRGYGIPCTSADRDLWRTSSIPVFGIVHDEGKLRWTNLTAWARALASDAQPAAAPVDATFALDERRLPSFLGQARAYLRADGPPALVELASSDPARQRAAVIDAFGLGRNDARPLLLLRACLPYMRDRAALAPAIQVLTLTVGHGDIFWTADNWLPEGVQNEVRSALRWSPEEVEQLIAVTEPEEWCRGGLGQSVHALLDADPGVNRTIEHVYSTTTDDEVALRCLLILVDAARDDGLAQWTRLVESRPGITANDLTIELRRLLEEFGFFTLWD